MFNFSLHVKKRLLTKIAAAVCGITLFTGLASGRADAAAYPALRNTNGMVLSTSDLADAVGQKVLDNGGNAVDAAVAVGYALSVTHPSAGNIGGGGFAIIHMADGTDAALDFREKAPLAATRNMYLDSEGNVIPGASTIGHKAAGVPGTVAGMSAMLEKFGTKPLAELVKPSIELAEKGFVISHHEAATMKEAHDLLLVFTLPANIF